MGKEFDLRVSLAVVDHAFHDSFGDGIQAVREELRNVFSRSRELLLPDRPFPDLVYEVRNNRLYWPGDKLSAEHHLRRYVVWLQLNGGSAAQLEQARLDLAVFREAQQRALNLNVGEAVLWLAQRTPEPADGVALQQIRKEGDKLIQTSQLLPFERLDQINLFQEEILDGREDVSLNDSVGGWMVQGEALDFWQDVPEIIERAREPVSTTGPVIVPIFEPASLPFQQDIPVPVSEATGFWFEVMAAAAEPVAVENTSGSEPEVVKVNEAVAKQPAVAEKVAVSKLSKPVIRREGAVVKPTRIIPEGKMPDKLEKQPTGPRLEGSKPTKTVFVAQKEETPVYIVASKSKDKPTRTVLVGKKKDNFNVTVSKLSAEKQVVYRRSKPNGGSNTVPQCHGDTVTILPPVWQPSTLPLNEKEVPQLDLIQWVGDSQQDFTIFIIVRHYAILYTILVHLSDGRGSGWVRQRALVYAS